MQSDQGGRVSKRRISHQRGPEEFITMLGFDVMTSLSTKSSEAESFRTFYCELVAFCKALDGVRACVRVCWWWWWRRRRRPHPRAARRCRAGASTSSSSSTRRGGGAGHGLVRGSRYAQCRACSRPGAVARGCSGPYGCGCPFRNKHERHQKH